MTTYYAVLWMPTVIHEDFNYPVTTELELFQISDNLPLSVLQKEDDLLWIRLTLSDRDITIQIYTDEKEECFLETQTLVLKYMTHSRNGLFKYEINIPDDHISFQTQDTCPTFPCDIYHHIKEFYHIHEHHHKGNGDTMLKPYMQKSDIDIKTKNNDAIVHYFNQFHNKFLEAHKTIKRLYSSIHHSSSAAFLHFIFFKNYESFFNLVITVKGDKIYYNSLYKSCYNTSVQVTDPEDTTIQDDAKQKRRIAFNINNIVENVINLEENIVNRFALSTSRISFWIAIGAVGISIFFSLLS
jgi:hypothetical protein